MKFTVTFITLLSISTTWADKDKKSEEPKDKREAPSGYPSSGHSYSLQSPSSHLASGQSYSLQSPSSGQSYNLQSSSSGHPYSLQSGSSGHSYSLQSPSSGQAYSLQSPSSGQSYSLQSPSSGQSYSLQSPSLGHEDASAISVGAGYSVGGAKPSYNFGGQSSSGHSTIKLAPITLQPSHGGFASNDLSQLMSQLSHGLNTGAISLQSLGNLGGSYASAGQAAHGAGKALSLPQFSFGGAKLQQYAVSEPPPSYAAGTKGLSSYSTGPVLFNPESHGNQQQFLNYGGPSSGHSFGESSGAASLGGSGHSLGGLSLGGSGHSFGGSIKSLGSSYVVPSKASFKPSAYVSSSGHDDSGYGSSISSGSYSSPSLSGFSLSGSHGGLSSIASDGHDGLSSLSSGGHGASFGSLGGFGGGSSKFIASAYIPSKSEGFGSSLESVASFASNGHLSSPSSSLYGKSSSFPSNSAFAASSNNPQYYEFPKQSAAFAGAAPSFKAPLKGHSSLSSFSSGPKYSFGASGGSNSRYEVPKDSHGAYSESTYNTIKYSEELKPHVH